ncbi:MAG: hypothetical protein U1F83_19925 [Verrucomicrobiota bacterium]
MVPNAPVGAVVGGQSVGWCPGTENWLSSPWNINVDAYRTNVLGPYVNNVQVYKCPSDRIPSDNGDRIRSISMNPALVGDLPQSSVDSMTQMIKGWRLFKKLTDLNCIGVANAWVFCDEAMYNLNDGYLQCDLVTPGYRMCPPIIIKAAMSSLTPTATLNTKSGCTTPATQRPVSRTSLISKM